MTAPELKPCPFCGEPVQMNDYTNKPAAAWVMIHRCAVIGPIKLDGYSGSAISAAWNTRADLHDATESKLAKAVDALRACRATFIRCQWDEKSVAVESIDAVLAEIEKGGM